MKQVETKHRKYQILKWISALKGRYPDGRSTYPPTLSNLTLHMLEADVRKDAMIRLFGGGALRKPYNKRMVNYFKRYLNKLLGHYQRNLFNEQKIPKSERHSYGIQTGVEAKTHTGIDATAYFLSNAGYRELDDLHEMAQLHHELTPPTYRKSTVDKIIVPKKERGDGGLKKWYSRNGQGNE